MKISAVGFKELRLKNNYSQTKLAESLGTVQSNIANLENEKKSSGMSFDMFIGLCRVYRQSPTVILKKLGVKLKE